MKILLQKVWVDDTVTTELLLVNEEGNGIAYIAVTSTPSTGDATHDLHRKHGAISMTWIPAWPQDEWERLQHMATYMPIVIEYMRQAPYDPEWRLAYEASMETHRTVTERGGLYVAP